MFVNIQKSGTVLLNSPLTNSELLARIETCGTPTDFGWSFCRIAGCHRCRKYRTRAWIDEAVDLFADRRPGDLRFVTVMLQPVGDVNDVRREIDRGKVAWRNIIYRLRQKDPRARGIRIIGAAETDWYYPHHTPRLSSYKRDQLTSLGFDTTAGDVWMPHLHLIVDLAGTPKAPLADALRRKWPGSRQIDIKALDPFRETSANITRLLSYSMKHKGFYRIDPFHQPTTVRWPDCVRVAYYNMLFEAGGFSLLRFHLKPDAALKGHEQEWRETVARYNAAELSEAKCSGSTGLNGRNDICDPDQYSEAMPWLLS